MAEVKELAVGLGPLPESAPLIPDLVSEFMNLDDELRPAWVRFSNIFLTTNFIEVHRNALNYTELHRT